jgi:hypothetical protein
MLAALGGVTATIVASGQLRAAVVDQSDSLDRALAASGEALRTADDTVAIVASIVDQLAGSLVAVEDAASDSISTIDGAESGLRKLAEISGEDLPRIVESLQEAMPALIQVADVIDGALGALSFVGVPYDPDVPFDESLAGVASSIENLPEQVRAQAVLIGEVGDGLGRLADQAGDLVVEVGAARAQLADGLELLNQYRATTAAAIDAVEAQRQLIDTRIKSERSAIWWIGAAVIIAQVGLFGGGAWLVFRRDGLVAPADIGN